MGTSFNPQTVQSGFRDEQLINDILADIRTDLENKVDRNGVLPNAMAADLDMGANQLVNVAQGVIGTDGVNLNQLTNVATQIATTILGVAGAGGSNSNPLTFNYGVAEGSQGTVNRTVFNLNTLFGVSSFNGLTVVVNGVVQIPGLSYVVDGTEVTFSESLNTDTDILFIYGDLSPLPTVPLFTNNYDISVFVAGQPGASQEIIRFAAVRDTFFADDFANSILDAGTAATASTEFDIQVDGVSVGDVTVGAAGTTGTFTTDSGTLTVTAGEILSVIAPATPDATIADISLTLYGQRA